MSFLYNHLPVILFMRTDIFLVKEILCDIVNRILHKVGQPSRGEYMTVIRWGWWSSWFGDLHQSSIGKSEEDSSDDPGEEEAKYSKHDTWFKVQSSLYASEREPRLYRKTNAYGLKNVVTHDNIKEYDLVFWRPMYAWLETSESIYQVFNSLFHLLLEKILWWENRFRLYLQHR